MAELIAAVDGLRAACDVRMVVGASLALAVVCGLLIWRSRLEAEWDRDRER